MPYTICIIDDEEVSERMLSAILKIEGYEIISASNGKKLSNYSNPKFLI